MNKKIITLLLVVIFSAAFLSVVSADNNTTDTAPTSESEDTANYIVPVSITDNGIKFSDGFTGFCIDLSKNKITTDDKFSSKSSTDSENILKLAIIECYKANRENEIGSIISKVINNDTGDKIVEKVLSSQENIGDNAVVEINNDTEATFNFELLKSVSSEKSDCLAYKVSLKTVKHNDTLSAANDENSTENAQTDNATNSSDKKTEPVENNTEKTVIETNKTIVNKTNTLIINENNTTTINQNNTKVINRTNDTPENATIPDIIMRTAGNPIFILVVVIIIVAIVAVTMRRKD